MSEGGVAWFAPKRHGYGTGLPIAWQGWALPGGFLTLPRIVGFTLKPHPAAGITLPLVAAPWSVMAVKRRARGGWRRQWGA